MFRVVDIKYLTYNDIVFTNVYIIAKREINGSVNPINVRFYVAGTEKRFKK